MYRWTLKKLFSLLGFPLSQLPALLKMDAAGRRGFSRDAHEDPG